MQNQRMPQQLAAATAERIRNRRRPCKRRWDEVERGLNIMRIKDRKWPVQRSTTDCSVGRGGGEEGGRGRRGGEVVYEKGAVQTRVSWKWLNHPFRGLTLRRLMSYIYIYMEHPFLMFLDHTRRRSTVGRTPLDEWWARRRDLYLLRSWVRIPPGAWIFVCCECRVLSGRGLCDELITRPEESYRLCCVVAGEIPRRQFIITTTRRKLKN